MRDTGLARTKLLKEGLANGIGEVQVREDEVDAATVETLDGITRGVRKHDLVAEVEEDLLEERSDRWLLVHAENGGHVSGKLGAGERPRSVDGEGVREPGLILLTK
jgi:hypothetical protein